MAQHTHARLQGGIRRGPRMADNFTILSNAVLDDDRLSFRARGLLVWLLAKPADWHIRSESIARHSPKEGRDAVRSAMRELVDVGYLVVEKFQDERGRWITVQTIYERPTDHMPPGPEKSTLGVSDVGHPGALTSTEKPRTRTNNDVVAPFSPQDDNGDCALQDLRAATSKAGLVASFARVKPQQRCEILALTDLHGVDALVAAARGAHRPSNPTMHVHGWLPLWRSLPAPRPSLPPTCGQCDEYGWLSDDEFGRAVRCACRRQVAA
ncbi:replication protein [Rhodococcus pyridinivorans]|uniref:replication protein n=1 Tax=Rhodococcus pyridinivorans TaxID=103816 RepID=UPI001E60A8D1|nr:replication protein [Rhodococcus pyridinivorans]MCD5419163.1 replication protein [Rhodococcus pyridinivorans]